MRLPHLWMLLSIVVLAGCAGADRRSTLDRLRDTPPVAVAEVEASFEAVAACLTDELLRHGLQATPNARPDEGRATVTGYSRSGSRQAVPWLRLEYEVVRTGPSKVQIAVRRFRGLHPSTAAPDELRDVLGDCGWTARVTDSAQRSQAQHAPPSLRQSASLPFPV